VGSLPNTSDGRKLALDQRIMNPLLFDDPGSKVNACVNNILSIRQESAEIKGAKRLRRAAGQEKGAV